MKFSEITNLTADEIKQKLTAFKKELFELYYQVKTGRIEQPHRIKQLKRDIARCLTALNQNK